MRNDWKERLRSEEFIVRWGKALVFCALVAVEIVLAVNNRNAERFGVPSWMVVVPVIALLTAENAVKMWALRSFKSKIVCYVLDTLALLVLTLFTDGALISLLYVVILSEFYLSQEKMSGNIAMCACSIGLFLITLTVSGILHGENVNVTGIVSNAFNDLMLLFLHFLIFNFMIQLYRKSIDLVQANEELHESNERLTEAYRELQEITALEERQRIAKDIHDTAGHSITTVIMQTEAAKLIIDSDPEDAKRKISAANLQAKHALEELRESVHLLSGAERASTLKEELETIVHESSDGTGIVVRSEIDEIELCDAKRRLIANALKEGISNGLRHGGATAFWFELREDGTHADFLLSDNGSGVELSSLKEGFGLSGMLRRARSLGGDVWFESEPGEGFEIHMTLPLDGINRSAP